MPTIPARVNQRWREDTFIFGVGAVFIPKDTGIAKNIPVSEIPAYMKDTTEIPPIDVNIEWKGLD